MPAGTAGQQRDLPIPAGRVATGRFAARHRGNSTSGRTLTKLQNTLLYLVKTILKDKYQDTLGLIREVRYKLDKSEEEGFTQAPMPHDNSST